MALREGNTLLLECEKICLNFSESIKLSGNLKLEIKKQLIECVNQLKDVVIKQNDIIIRYENEISTQVSQQNDRHYNAVVNIEKQLQEMNQNLFNRSYSEALKSTPVLKMANKSQHVVIVRPDDKNIASTETEKLLKKTINPQQLKIGVKRVKNIRDGGVLIECRTEEECEKLSQEISSKTRGLTTDRPKKREPKLVIKGVSSEIKDTQLIDEIITNNSVIHRFLDGMTQKEIESHISLKFKFRKKSKTRDDMYCIQISPQLKTIINGCQTLFIGWNSCHFEDYLPITRCFNCNGFGHISNNCNQSYASCGHCGGKHKTHECNTDRSSSFCTNCDKFNKSKSQQILDCKHSAFSSMCQSFLKVQEIVKSKINYEY
jgi:hypothetical protein